MKKKEDQTSNVRRQALLDSAARVLRALPGGSMAELAEGLGVSRATLYRFFPNRDALISALALDSLRLTEEAAKSLPLSTSYRAAFHDLVCALVPIGDRYYFLMNEPRALRDPKVKAGIDEQYEQMYAFIDEAKAAGELRADLPTRWIATIFDSIIWAAWWSVAEGNVAAKDVADLATTSFWQGVAKENVK